MSDPEETHKSTQFVIAQVDSQLFAIPLSLCERTVQMASIRPMANVPDFIKGTINLHGELIPVIDLRAIFDLPRKEPALTDQLFFVKAHDSSIALWVDTVVEIIERKEQEIEQAGRFFLQSEVVKGVFMLEDKTVLLHDLDKLLTAEQLRMLQASIRTETLPPR
ncbi:MAG: chemotaxis protein CheW [Bacteroidetes bacterium]|nr:chemotaxis protein CheW [Bacteroidota bacterium]